MMAAAAANVATHAPASAMRVRPLPRVSARKVNVPRQRGIATRVAVPPTSAPAINQTKIQNKIMRPSRGGPHRASERGCDDTREPRDGNDVSERRQRVSKCRQKRRKKQAIT